MSVKLLSYKVNEKSQIAKAVAIVKSWPGKTSSELFWYQSTTLRFFDTVADFRRPLSTARKMGEVRTGERRRSSHTGRLELTWYETNAT